MDINEQIKGNKFSFKKLLLIIIPILIISVAAVIFLCNGSENMFLVTGAKYEAIETNQMLKYNYDKTGRLSSVTVDGKDRYIYTYSADYKTVTIENKSDNTKKTVKFNDNFDVIEKNYSDGTKETFSYDTKGNLISSVNTDGVKTTFYYDGKKLIAEDYSNGDRVEYEYAGKRIAREVIYAVNGQTYQTFYHYNDNKTIAIKDMVYDAIEYEYDSKKRVLSQTNNANVSMSYTYDEYDNITSITFPTPATIEYTYEKVDISKEAYKQNKHFITYNDVLNEEVVQLLR